MKRDMNLIRSIILLVRDSDTSINIKKFNESYPDIDDKTYSGHAELLVEAGLVVASINITKEKNGHYASGAVIKRLTWEGHNFADAITNEDIWNKAKNKVIKPTASWSFKVLLKALEAEILSSL